MRGEDARRAQLLERFEKEGIAQRPRRLFETPAVRRRVFRGVAVTQDKGDAVFPAPALDKGRVPQRFLPADAVLEVGDDDVISFCVQQMQQAHGIRPAGHGAQKLFASARRGVELNTHLRAASRRG